MSLSKIKICHINTRFLFGGATKNTLLTIENLDVKRYQIDLIVGRDVYWPQLRTLKHIRVIQIPKLIRAVHPPYDFFALLSIYRILKANEYHIVHTHIAKAGLIGRLAAKLAGVPIIIHGLHGTTFHSGHSKFIRKFFISLETLGARYTDCFVCVGEHLKNLYLSQKIGTPRRYTVIRSGMALDQFYSAGLWSESKVISKKQELGIQPQQPIVGYVASLEPRKGHKYAIEAIHMIASRHPNIRGLFVGDGFYRSELEKIVAKLGLTDIIIFAGYRQDIAEVTATFDVKIFTSQWEGLPQVLVQAVAAGKPVVSFDVEGVREVIDDGNNGYVVPARDSQMLARKVSHLLDDLSLSKQMGARGRELVDASWSIETMVEKTEELYERLFNKKCLSRANHYQKDQFA